MQVTDKPSINPPPVKLPSTIRWGNPLVVSVLAFLVALALFLTWLSLTWNIRIDFGLSLLVLGCVSIFPFYLAWIRKKFNIYEPIYYVILAAVIYYGIIPIVLWLSDGIYMLGRDYSYRTPEVILFTSFALLVYYVIYYAVPNRSLDNVNNFLIDHYNKSLYKLRGYSILVTVLILVLIVLWIVVGRIPLSSLWTIGDAGYGDWSQSGSGPLIGYLYGARESLPACILLLIATRRNRGWNVLDFVLIAFTVLLLASTGGRARVLILVMAVGAYFYMERGRQPGIFQTLLAVGTIFYFIIGAIGYYRSPSHALGEDIFTFDQAIDTFVESSAIVVGDSALLTYVPEYIPYVMGRTFTKILIQWVPRIIWPEKPSFPGWELLGQYYIRGAPISYWGEFYFNFGPLGIVLGMALMAVVSKLAFRVYASRPTRVNMIVLSLLNPFLLHAFGRGDMAIHFYGAVYVFGPALVAAWLLRRFVKQPNEQGV
jgi:oligosaccharide repeat unit polymerase